MTCFFNLSFHLYVGVSFPCLLVTVTEPTGSSGIFTAGSEIIAFVMYSNCASVKVKARMLQRKKSAFCDQLFGEVQIVSAS